MPELPEVEIVKRSLKNTIEFRKIKKVIVNNRNLRFKIHKNFNKEIENKIITNIRRYAKYIIIELDFLSYMTIHLGMSGTIHLVKNATSDNTNLSFYHSKNLPNKHNHVILNFGSFNIIYNDPRRFGYFKLHDSKKSLDKFIKQNGLEPLDRNFNYKYLSIKIQNREKNIKNILLDQKIISGIGNIYASEILFYSKINPLKKGKNLKSKSILNLTKYARIVLRNAIKKGGSSIRDFKNIQSDLGRYQNEFKVYDRQNKKCLNKKCKSFIKKMIISNRSTYYCQKCQK
tara:strand:+ start:189 stop:1049 length:861 start_codon:yes stop_codon:yes gene_type:complete